tara:strand:- start:139 stop:699 length:561 start_codon:yes stop_codon:yes gene_type:complete
MKEYGRRLRLSKEEEELVYQNRAETVDNINGNTALGIHLNQRGIDKKDVVSVKHWQSASGELRFSIVTKESVNEEQTILPKLKELIENHSPEYKKIKRNKKDTNEHLLIINPADIHIGKYSNENETGDGYNVDIAVERVIEGINGILDKVDGFNIDRILFCIGNDVLHIDNVYNQTTAGTSSRCRW